MTDVERITCPECGGSGLMTYPFVGDNCPCMTCSGGTYEQIQHVEMLRDALAEHEHRGGMVARIAVVLVERLPRDEAYEAARQILDTIEAA